MIAVDTNILLRWIVKSEADAAEHGIAFEFMESHRDLFVSQSVLLELEWVLRGRYKLKPPEVHAALSGLMNADNITVENEHLATEALRHHHRGMDFTDAMHLVAARNCDALATFDKDLARLSKRLSLKPPCVMPG